MKKYSFISWSGGKDSCLALYKSIKMGYIPKKLLTMFSKENNISTAHRLKKEIIREQALSIGLEYVIGETLFQDYEEKFVNNLKAFKKQGIDYGVFGDIDIENHKLWEDNICKKGNMKAILPLWQCRRKEIVEEFLSLGFKAKIVVVNKNMLDSYFLGKDLSLSLIQDIENYGADACGENGEYHTVVYDGPIFKNKARFLFGNEIINIGENYAQIEVNVI